MSRRDPTFLTEVMDTIASFKDSKGSPPDKILDRIISQRRTPLKNASLHVKKALRTGLKSGLIKEIGGKYKLSLGSKDYTIFKNFTMLEKGLPIKQLRRGRRRRSRRRGHGRRGRGRRGRRRHRNESFDDDNLDLDNDVMEDLSLVRMANSSTLPVKELRRRGRRGRSRKGRRRRGRRRSNILTMDDDTVDMENDTNGEPMDRGRRRRRKGKKRGRRGRRRALEDEGESAASSESKELSKKSSEEKPKTAPGGNGESRNGNEKRDIVPEPPSGSSHCIHNIHHDGVYYGHPPHQGHYGGEYYD